MLAALVIRAVHGNRDARATADDRASAQLDIGQIAKSPTALACIGHRLITFLLPHHSQRQTAHVIMRKLTL
jgi:hypothetical protein